MHKQCIRQLMKQVMQTKMAEAQEQLSKAVLAEQTANNMSQQVQTQILNDLPVEETPEQQPQQIDEDLQRWAAKNPWFMGTEPIHKEMSSYAMYVDNALRTNGIDPAKEAEKYYAEVDKEMRNKFPNFLVFNKQLRKKWLKQKIDNLKQLLPVPRGTPETLNPRKYV